MGEIFINSVLELPSEQAPAISLPSEDLPAMAVANDDMMEAPSDAPMEVPEGDILQPSTAAVDG